jgi:hypothetical protein
VAITKEDQRKALLELLRAQQMQPTVLPEQLGMETSRPGTQKYLAGIQAIRETHPVESPFPGGTPTQRRKEFEEAKRQFEEQMKFEREKFAAEQAYRQAALALQRSSASGGGSGVSKDLLKSAAYSSIKALVDKAIREGKGWSLIEYTIAQRPDIAQTGISQADALKIAFDMYSTTLSQFGGDRYKAALSTLPNPQAATRYFKDKVLDAIAATPENLSTLAITYGTVPPVKIGEGDIYIDPRTGQPIPGLSFNTLIDYIKQLRE